MTSLLIFLGNSGNALGKGGKALLDMALISVHSDLLSSSSANVTVLEVAGEGMREARGEGGGEGRAGMVVGGSGSSSIGDVAVLRRLLVFVLYRVSSLSVERPKTFLKGECFF